MSAGDVRSEDNISKLQSAYISVVNDVRILAAQRKKVPRKRISTAEYSFENALYVYKPSAQLSIISKDDIKSIGDLQGRISKLRSDYEKQRQFFEEFIKEHSDWKLIEVYYDEGITGTSTKHREGFNKMIADCEKGLIETILTKEVSRFARNTVDTLTYTRKLSELGVNAIFMNDGIDTSDKDGELRLSIMSSIAQEESRKLSERIKWGLKRRMEKGDAIGRRSYYGYRIVDNKYVVVPEEAEIVRRIFHEYYYDKKGSTLIAQGLNADNILSATGVAWTSCSVLAILKNEKYCGDLTQWKSVTESYLTKRCVKNDGSNPDTPTFTIKDHHIAIVTHEVWDGVQAEIAKRGNKISEGRKHSNKYWFSGKVSCGKCGKPFGLSGATKSQKQRKTLRCTNRAYYGAVPTMAASGEMIGCDNKTVQVESVECCIRYVLQNIQVSKSPSIKV